MRGYRSSVNAHAKDRQQVAQLDAAYLELTARWHNSSLDSMPIPDPKGWDDDGVVGRDITVVRVAVCPNVLGFVPPEGMTLLSDVLGGPTFEGIRTVMIAVPDIAEDRKPISVDINRADSSSSGIPVIIAQALIVDL